MFVVTVGMHACVPKRHKKHKSGKLFLDFLGFFVAMNLYVGTSGYSYKEWKGSFYPATIPAKDMLSYYASQFHAVELNNTSYRLPQPGMIESWKAQVPDDFRFSVKASQFITHFKQLKDVANPTTL